MNPFRKFQNYDMEVILMVKLLRNRIFMCLITQPINRLMIPHFQPKVKTQDQHFPVPAPAKSLATVAMPPASHLSLEESFPRVWRHNSAPPVLNSNPRNGEAPGKSASGLLRAWVTSWNMPFLSCRPAAAILPCLEAFNLDFLNSRGKRALVNIRALIPSECSSAPHLTLESH